jgi:hypothetical protein
MEMDPSVRYDFEKSTFSQKEIIMHPVIVSAIQDAKLAKLPLKSLDSILHEAA